MRFTYGEQVPHDKVTDSVFVQLVNGLQVYAGQRVKRSVLAVAAMTVLTACGGGGGGDEGAANASSNNGGSTPVASQPQQPATAQPPAQTQQPPTQSQPPAQTQQPPAQTQPPSQPTTSQPTGNAGSANNQSNAPKSIQARVLIGDYIFADGDTQNPSNTDNANNNPAGAQQIISPSTVRGYANCGSSSGNICTRGDFRDYYQLSMRAGDSVTMSGIEAPATTDFDLVLHRNSDGRCNNVVDSSQGPGVDELLLVPSGGTGDYCIEVSAKRGAGSYVLHVDTGLAAAAARSSFSHSYRASLDFVPYEYIMQFIKSTASQLPLQLINTDRVLSFASQVGLTLFSGVEGAEQLMGVSSASAAAGVANILGGAFRERRFIDDTVRDRHRTLVLAKLLRSRDDVAFVEPNLIRGSHIADLIDAHYNSPVEDNQLNVLSVATREPNDPKFDLQWGYTASNFPAAWAETIGSPNVEIAVIDTGVLLEHPELQGQLSPSDPNGHDFVRNNTDGSSTNAHDGDGVDDNAMDPGTGRGNARYHGTHVAGIIAAKSDNGSSVAGGCWRCKILPLRAIGRDYGSSYDVMQAIRFAAGLSNNSNTTAAVKAAVINLSLGGEGRSNYEQSVITEARKAGVIIIASAGNTGNNVVNYPASYSGVVSVAATQRSGVRANYSVSNEFVDVAAPGGTGSDGIVSISGNESGSSVTYTERSLIGTSMAAPQVAAIVGLMKSVHPGLTPDQFDQLLLSGRITDDAGPAGRDDQYGSGVINAQKAVAAASSMAAGGAAPAVAKLNISPGMLSFGLHRDARDFTLAREGSGQLKVTAVRSNRNWLNVSAKQVNADKLGSYTATINRSILPQGYNEAIVTIESSSGSSEMVVSVRRARASDPAADAGTAYLLIKNSQGSVVQTAQAVTAQDGAYEIDIAGLAAGSYRLFAGTDQDNDRSLCDAGEVCAVSNSGSNGIAFTVNAATREVTGIMDFFISASPGGSLRR